MLSCMEFENEIVIYVWKTSTKLKTIKFSIFGGLFRGKFDPSLSGRSHLLIFDKVLSFTKV